MNNNNNETAANTLRFDFEDIKMKFQRFYSPQRLFSDI